MTRDSCLGGGHEIWPGSQIYDTGLYHLAVTCEPPHGLSQHDHISLLQ